MTPPHASNKEQDMNLFVFFFFKKKTAQQEALCCWYPWVLNGTTACCEELTALDFFVVVLGHTKRSLCQQPMLTHT